MNLTDAEFEKLKNTTSEQEWNDTCDEIKKARKGNYPPDWFLKILASGFAHTQMSKWS